MLCRFVPPTIVLSRHNNKKKKKKIQIYFICLFITKSPVFFFNFHNIIIIISSYFFSYSPTPVILFSCLFLYFSFIFDPPAFTPRALVPLFAVPNMHGRPIESAAEPLAAVSLTMCLKFAISSNRKIAATARLLPVPPSPPQLMRLQDVYPGVH